VRLAAMEWGHCKILRGDNIKTHTFPCQSKYILGTLSHVYMLTALERGPDGLLKEFSFKPSI